MSLKWKNKCVPKAIESVSGSSSQAVTNIDDSAEKTGEKMVAIRESDFT